MSVRAALAAFFSSVILFTGVPAYADDAAPPAADAVIAQAKPIGQVEAPLKSPSLPQGLSYTLDTAFSYSLGNTGSNGKLPGTWDGVLGYGITRNIRVQAGYYQYPEYPIGFSTGSVPVYLQGTGSPIGTQSLSSLDSTIKNGILVTQAQFLVPIAKKGAIVISPTYVARWGTVGGHSDSTLVINPANGLPTTVDSRTFQFYLLAFTIPLVSSPKFFVTYTIAPQWNVKLNGLNQQNHAQLFQLGYAEYRPTKTSTIFFQPSMLQNYTPTDQYAEHIPTVILGATQRIPKSPFYAQVQMGTGTPTNPPNNQIGISSLTCQQLPCAPSQTAARITGLKAATIQFMLGIGTPSVVPL